MPITFKTTVLIAWAICMLQCKAPQQTTFSPQKKYQSTKLTITQIAEHSYLHTSYLQTNDFGYVPCNGLLVKSQNEAIIFDTPTNDSAAQELITFIQENLKCKINAVIPTHFHDDCLGGLSAFTNHHLPSFANTKTIELATAKNTAVPQNGFTDSIILKVGSQPIVARHFGEGHTKDNVVGYFPLDNILFGGCLIKELKASKGYLGDANVAAWSATVEKVKQAYPQVKIVVPGHGQPGGSTLLDYTIKLFQTP
ncbi:MAG: subclass metallo-beta-lactamase [Bacteroidota bacterium]|jgi:metallo-beta-lactamase class B